MMVTSIAPGLNPHVRRVRRVEENRAASMIKTGLFALLWLLAVPITAIESACHGGATLMLEARLKRVEEKAE
jgi:hypothetical protein